MKPTTKEWLKAAKDDLDAAQTLVLKQNLTNLAAFHCQQCIEKCFKAVIEETNSFINLSIKIYQQVNK